MGYMEDNFKKGGLNWHLSCYYKKFSHFINDRIEAKEGQGTILISRFIKDYNQILNLTILILSLMILSQNLPG